MRQAVPECIRFTTSVRPTLLCCSNESGGKRRLRRQWNRKKVIGEVFHRLPRIIIRLIAVSTGTIEERLVSGCVWGMVQKTKHSGAGFPSLDFDGTAENEVLVGRGYGAERPGTYEAP